MIRHLRNLVSAIGLGHKQTLLHDISDKVFDAVVEHESSLVSGTVTVEGRDITIAIGVDQDSGALRDFCSEK